MQDVSKFGVFRVVGSETVSEKHEKATKLVCSSIPPKNNLLQNRGKFLQLYIQCYVSIVLIIGTNKNMYLNTESALYNIILYSTNSIL